MSRTLVLAGASAFVIASVLCQLAIRRALGKPSAQARQLVYPLGRLFSSLLGGGLFLGASVVSNIYRNPTVTVFTTTFFIVFGLWGLAGALNYVVVRHVVSETGMEFRRITGATVAFQWSEVVRVDFSDSMKWFRIRLSDGRSVRVSATLLGLPDFARLLLAVVPAALIDDKALTLLQSIIAGRFPLR